MVHSLFERVVVPVASEDDARSTARVARDYVADAGGTVTVVHVIEKAGGAPDKASVEQREERAEGIFDAAREAFGDVPVETHIEYATDVADGVFAAAAEVDASAVVFTPRSGGRWIRLLTGDVALDMITHNDRPVIVLPDADEEPSEDETGEETGEDHT